MAKFKFVALGGDGATVTGVQTAPSNGAAHMALRRRGLNPVEVAEKKNILQFEVTRKKVPRKELMHFSRQLAVFIRAGIPLLDALETIGSEVTNSLFRKTLDGVIEALKAGDTFAGAASAHPEAFPHFYLGILGSAELTGNLDTVLDQLADYIDRDLEARRKVTSALMYPGIVMAMSLVTIVVLTGWVLPRFETFFKSLNATLPLPTRMLLAVAHFFTTWWLLIVVVIVLAAVVGALGVRTRPGRDRLDGFLLRLPLAGDLLHHAILERFCRILGSMVQAGVALPEAMAVTAEATNNAVYRRGLTGARLAMLNGEGLAAPLAQTGLFPGAARQMFRVGEETGTLDEQLATAAIYYDRELDYRIKRFTSVFEPAVIVIMGLIVGFVAVALVSAMYGIYRQVKLGG